MLERVQMFVVRFLVQVAYVLFVIALELRQVAAEKPMRRPINR